MKRKSLISSLVVALVLVSVVCWSAIKNDNSYNATFYSSDGNKFMEMSGRTIDMSSNSMTVTIDSKDVDSCGNVIVFAEKGLSPDANDSKSKVVVIKSQLGDTICSYSGNKVYWEVCKDLPKTTKLMIDGKALYIHRANFQIIDKS